MPCCVCIETVFRRNDGGKLLAVFEHAEAQPMWFGDGPQIKAYCNGKPTRIVQRDGQLVVSWKQDQRYVTVIGMRDVEEVTRLMAHLDGIRNDVG
ncbi:MAG: hypothetical protein ACC628_06490 [Pirellulaceae bacterium]